MASSSKDTLNPPADELTDFFLYLENHTHEGKSNTELNDDRKRSRDAYFERWLGHALANDTANATLFREKYDKSDRTGQKRKAENLDVVTAKKAFTDEFVDVNGVMNEFEQHIKYCLDTCNKDPVYAPYFALIQSSGYGKSRLIAELAQNTYVIYICLHSSDAHGYPLRTSVADDLLLTLTTLQRKEGALAAI
ncbi:8711_t:CDS:2, partial [Paraglomus brasilianum]